MKIPQVLAPEPGGGARWQWVWQAVCVVWGAAWGRLEMGQQHRDAAAQLPGGQVVWLLYVW